MLTSDGAPTGSCTTGDSDVDLSNGEVYSCESSAWTDSGHSIQGVAGMNGTNGASVLTSDGAPTGSCTSGDSDVDLSNGEVYSCESSAWTDSGQSVQGPAGTNGSDGSDGSNGASVLTSDGAPTGSCTSGDSDVDLSNGEVYSCESSAWTDTGQSVQGPAGTNGSDGSDGSNGASVLTSDGAPTGSCTSGDTDIDLTSGEVYSCVSMEWTDTEHSIQGPAGTNGTDGTDGTNGASVLTSDGAPTGSCTSGDSDVDLSNGEVYSCESSAWTDSSYSIKWSAASSTTTVVAKGALNGTTVTAYCPSGYQTVGGGASGSGTTALAASYPSNASGGKLTANGQVATSWTVVYVTEVGASYSPVAYVICSQ